MSSSTSTVGRGFIPARPKIKLAVTHQPTPQDFMLLRLQEAVKMAEKDDVACDDALRVYLSTTLKLALGYWGTAETFWKVAKRGDAVELERLIRLGHGMDVNSHWENRGTALHAACGAGHAACAEMLIRAGCKPSEPDLFAGDTPLHEALSTDDEKHRETLALLLHFDADSNRANRNLMTPLHVAVAEGMEEQVAVLLRDNALPRPQNREGQTPADLGREALGLLWKPGAACSVLDHTQYQEDLARITQCVTLVEEASEEQARRLWTCAGEGDLEAIRAMVKQHMDVDSHWGKKGTALHAAAAGGQVEVCNFLLEEGEANPDIADEYGGDYPIHETLASDRDEHLLCLKLLLKYGAPPSASNNLGSTPLHTAAIEGLVRSVRALLLFGADAYACDREGRIPSVAAAHFRDCRPAPSATANLVEKERHEEDLRSINECINLLKSAANYHTSRQGSVGGAAGGRAEGVDGAGGADGADGADGAGPATVEITDIPSTKGNSGGGGGREGKAAARHQKAPGGAGARKLDNLSVVPRLPPVG